MIFYESPLSSDLCGIAIRIDPRETTIEQNFGCHAPSRLINTIFEDTPSTTVVWQPDVYIHARAVAEKSGVTRVVDIGSGSGEKLQQAFADGVYSKIAIDFQLSFDHADKEGSTTTWLECNLNSEEEIAGLDAKIPSEQPAIYILSDVIEHLLDPLPLLAWIRNRLIANPLSRFVVSTPDRARQGYASIDSPPANPAHVREWSEVELLSFFTNCGFEVEESGHTRSNQFDTSTSTVILVLKCSLRSYCRFLKRAGLAPRYLRARHALLTAEYASFHKTGGIGTFVQEQKANYGDDAVVMLIVSTDEEGLARAKSIGILTANHFLAEVTVKQLPPEDVALRAIRQLRFYFPSIAVIHYPDYQGIGVRLTQAKHCGMMPAGLQLVVHCHGMTHYLENASQSWFGLDHIGYAEKEKLSIELADIVVFPTNYLQYITAQAGIVAPTDRAVLMRYPLISPPLAQVPQGKVDTLVFFGKFTRMKGVDLFLSAVADNLDALIANGLKRVVMIGGGELDEECERARSILRHKPEIQYTELTGLDRSSAKKAIHFESGRAIVLMPYKADNHPFALMDVVQAGALPVMLDAGGIPELYPVHFHRALLSPPDVDALSKVVMALFKMDGPKLEQMRGSFIEAMNATQQGVNERSRYFDYASVVASAEYPRVAGPVADLTIIIPVFNTDIAYLDDLFFGIEQQTVKPAKVVVVDDASSKDYSIKLEEYLRDSNRTIPCELVRHTANKGLAGARNTGLAHVQTKYCANLDSDDIPLPDFVESIVVALDRNPGSAAAVPYLSAFDDGDDFNITRFGGYVYRPVGDGIISSQLDNILGHANSGYRTADLRELGAWDESDKSMWEDWALYLKLKTNGRNISIIPKTTCLYRVRQQSMLRTYKAWPAMRRLANNMSGLPRYENYRLQAMMRNYRDAARELQHAKAVMHDLKLRPQLMEQEYAAWEGGLIDRIWALEAKVSAQDQQLSRSSVKFAQSMGDRYADSRLVRWVARKLMLAGKRLMQARRK